MYARAREIGISEIGETVYVPNNDIAHLMYYLSCVNNLIDFGISNRLTDYANYKNIDFDDENQILKLAIILSPDEFVEKGVMIPVRYLGDSSNKFFRITDSQYALAATRQFVIGGKNVHTLKVMAFEMNWLEKHYSNPLMHYHKRINAIANGNVEKMNPKNKSRGCNIC